MRIPRRAVVALAASAALTAALAPAQAQSRKDSAIIGMVLEPPGLDPTTAPAAAIGEIVHYNVLEGLTKINMDGSVVPLLAESWTVEPDGRSYTFKLRKGVKFQDGEAFDASDVKFSFERAKAEGSTNKAKKAVFDNIARIDTPDPHTVILTLNNADGDTKCYAQSDTAASPGSASSPDPVKIVVGVGSGALPFGRLWYGEPNALGYAKGRLCFRSGEMAFPIPCGTVRHVISSIGTDWTKIAPTEFQRRSLRMPQVHA